MKLQITILCVLFATLLPLKSFADAPPDYLSGALQLWKTLSPTDQTAVFDSIHFIPITGEDAPLARYRPDKEGGIIEIGLNLRQYRRDYVYLVSNQDKIHQPDFDHYLTILTTLNLANESAHYMQDKNGSLHDFYEFYTHTQTEEACALYSLQQYVSDVVMLEKAVRIEYHFLGQGSIKGLNALYIALEKNNLRNEYEEFREGLKNKDGDRIDTILHIIRVKREDANMSGLDFCKDNGNAVLDETIISRATEPARSALAHYQSLKRKEKPLTPPTPYKQYND